MGWVLWLAGAGGVVVVEMQLWLHQKQCKLIGLYTTDRVSEKNENLAKITTWMKTLGSVYYIILMQSCHKRTEGIGDVWSSK